MSLHHHRVKEGKRAYELKQGRVKVELQGLWNVLAYICQKNKRDRAVHNLMMSWRNSHICRWPHALHSGSLSCVRWLKFAGASLVVLAIWYLFIHCSLSSRNLFVFFIEIVVAAVFFVLIVTSIIGVEGD